jgi:hypothetical protein
MTMVFGGLVVTVIFVSIIYSIVSIERTIDKSTGQVKKKIIEKRKK